MGGITSIAQALPVLAAPVLSRIYTPEEFGVYTVFISILSATWMVAGFRYEQAIILPEGDREAATLGSLARLFSLFFCSIWLLSTFILSDLWLQITGNVLSLFWIRMLAVTILVNSWMDQYMGILNRFQHYSSIAGARLSSNIVQVSSHIGLGLAGLTQWSLMFGKVIGDSTGLIWTWLRTKVHKTPSFPLIAHKSGALIKKYSSFPLYNGPHVLFTALATSIPSIIIANEFGSSAAGYYGLAFRAVILPLNLLTMTVYRVFYERFSRLMNAPELFRQKFLTTLKSLFVIAVIPTLLLWFYSGDVIPWVFGREWQASAPLAAYLSLIFFASTLTSPLMFVPLLFEKQRFFLVWEIINTIVRVGSIYWFAKMFDLNNAVFFYALISCVIICITLFMAFLIISNRKSYEDRYQG